MLIAVVIAYVGATAMTGNFHTVAEGEVYRSAQPSPAALERYVREHGIRTVINLRGENPSDGWYQDEVATSRRLGLRHIDFRMSAKRGITRREAWGLIQIMQRAPKPILIHCESGADRTGLASALYVAGIQRRGEDAAEEQLSLKYGHIAAPFGKGWGMTVTFEEMEPSLGFIGS
ncbi:protein tyrosine phosphatase [Pseudomonas sp. FW305-3-2-15-E-TSA4]|nr:protein tyrosine phosphatase [Pseudomonas sp. FW305-3-2-15-E-TSA4]